MSNEPNTVQRERKHAAIYFSPANSKAFKSLAARVRAEGGRTTCIWSSKWKGAENLLMEARAVVIERGCPNAEEICNAYRKYANDVEIHFVNTDGEFEEEGATDGRDDNEDGGDAPDESAEQSGEVTETDAVVQEESTDAGEEDSGDAPDAEPDSVEDVSGDGDDEGTEESSGSRSTTLD